MTASLNPLLRNILKLKGLTEEHLAQLTELGLTSREDFRSVGDAATLLELLPNLNPSTAARVLLWALSNSGPAPESPLPPPPEMGNSVVVNTTDSVFCTHCQFKQPKDYHPGDLCPNCGLQAEPIETCYWCGASGPNKYCRACGAAFVATADLPLALILRRDGMAKDDIPAKLNQISEAEKAALWGRVRRARL
ncbi:hypothetical protein ACFFLM_06495 [Deinococcus oregonensis]|uniref:DZANK-type domain-containing protein n=1 Tax=Deinococcus oregonensis TaxID=1805970 RepID=A0ABV6AVT3_9DEIO